MRVEIWAPPEQAHTYTDGHPYRCGPARVGRKRPQIGDALRSAGAVLGTPDCRYRCGPARMGRKRHRMYICIFSKKSLSLLPGTWFWRQTNHRLAGERSSFVRSRSMCGLARLVEECPQMNLIRGRLHQNTLSYLLPHQSPS